MTSFGSLLRLTLPSDFSFKLLRASEPNLERDFCDLNVDLGLSDSVKRLCTGLVTIQILTANSSSAFSASHGVNYVQKKI